MDPLTIFLCGDVMTGRGIDQILPAPGSPELQEEYVRDARTYIGLAEQVNGQIPRPVGVAWPWGDALAALEQAAPDVRLINLETAITSDGEFVPRKAVHYRMHPDNIGCLTVARPDVLALANNHVLDFGEQGLRDTLQALAGAGLRWVGAGRDAAEAERPAVVDVRGGRRVVVYSGGLESSGVPRRWAAAAHRPGVCVVPDTSDRSAAAIADRVCALTRPGDIAIASLHWGSNWGYGVGDDQVRFARRLVDGGIDVVHGHSSHHPRPIEVYRGKLILYGCGDLVNDYEGIRGYEDFRDDLRLLYLASLEDGELAELRIVPMQARRMRLQRAPGSDVAWLRSLLERISRRLGVRVQLGPDGELAVRPG